MLPEQSENDEQEVGNQLNRIEEPENEMKELEEQQKAQVEALEGEREQNQVSVEAEAALRPRVTRSGRRAGGNTRYRDFVI